MLRALRPPSDAGAATLAQGLAERGAFEQRRPKFAGWLLSPVMAAPPLHQALQRPRSQRRNRGMLYKQPEPARSLVDVRLIPFCARSSLTKALADVASIFPCSAQIWTSAASTSAAMRLASPQT